MSKTLPPEAALFLFLCSTNIRAAAIVSPDAAKPPAEETHALLEAACPAKSYAHAKEVGCSVCPTSDKETWTLGAVYFGNFVSANSTNALLAVQGCEAHVNDFGGAILLTRQGARWRKLRYYPGIIVESCHKLKFRTGRDLLVCEGSHTNQGVTDSVIYSLDFAAPYEKLMKLIFTVEDTTLACSAKVRKASIGKVAFGESGNISITASLGTATLSASQQERCLDNPESILAPTKEHRIEYTFDGEHFMLAPASEPAARLFR